MLAANIAVICNVTRVLNNIHPLLPLSLLALSLFGAGYGIVRLMS